MSPQVDVEVVCRTRDQVGEPGSVASLLEWLRRWRHYGTIGLVRLTRSLLLVAALATSASTMAHECASHRAAIVLGNPNLSNQQAAQAAAGFLAAQDAVLGY